GTTVHGTKQTTWKKLCRDKVFACRSLLIARKTERSVQSGKACRSLLIPRGTARPYPSVGTAAARFALRGLSPPYKSLRVPAGGVGSCKSLLISSADAAP